MFTFSFADKRENKLRKQLLNSHIPLDLQTNKNCGSAPCRLTSPYQNMAVCICDFTRVMSHPFERGWSQQGRVVFMRSGTTHSLPAFHGWLGKGESRDEILECATFALPDRFCSCSVSVWNHCVEEFVSSGFTVFIIVSLASFECDLQSL